MFVSDAIKMKGSKKYKKKEYRIAQILMANLKNMNNQSDQKM